MHSDSKQKVLQKIQQALKTTVPVPFNKTESSPIYTVDAEDNDVLFAKNFAALSGKFAYFENISLLLDALMQLLREHKMEKVFCNDDGLIKAINSRYPEFIFHGDLAGCDVALTGCEALVARTGSIVLSSIANGRAAGVFAPIHICIAHTSQVVSDISDALKKLREKYPLNMPSLISFASGPSRTADIEKTLVIGIHGPQEVYCLLAEDAELN